MRQLLDDLLDYSRASLDLGIPIAPASTDLSLACQEEIELQRVAWPDNAIGLSTEGPTQGVWDASRLKQVLGNLIANAAKYGDPGTPVAVRLIGNDDEVVLSVENTGPAIAADGTQSLFQPLQRGAHGDAQTERTSLGLGLFIVRQIVRAHGGTVSVSSADGKTVFMATLPTTHRFPKMLSVNNIYLRGHTPEADDRSSEHGEREIGSMQLFVADQ